MNKIAFYSCFLILITACESNQIDPTPEVKHFVLSEVLDHLPFDQFNTYSKAFFRDTLGNEFAFNMALDEKLVGDFASETQFTNNQIAFRYQLEFDMGIFPITVIATFQNLPKKGLSEIIICRSSSATSFERPELEIIPETNYKNTLYNEEYTWLGETYNNVYSNECIGINPEENLKIFYQPTIGVIGLTDNLNRSWIFDRFE